MAKSEIVQEDKWEVDNAVDTMIRVFIEAEEIKGNRNLFRKATKLLKEKKAALNKLLKDSD